MVSASQSALASNGINLIGFGAESVGMGGADLAVARDTSALNTNPAGLSQIDATQLDLYLGLANALEIRHKDQFGNDITIDNEWVSFSSFGFAHPIGDFTFGVGLFVQGGVGVEYDSIKTAFGTTDDLSTQLRIARITPGVSWQVNDRLSIGGSALMTYADLEQKIFPNTSVNNLQNPQQSFFGLQIDDVDTLSAGVKLGVLYKAQENLRVAAAYTSKTELNLDGGQAQINMRAIGLGIVTYNTVESRGVDQPEEAGLGLSWNVNDSFLLSAELNWINWSEAIKNSVLNLANPSNELASPSITQTTAINWKDQWVLALGTSYQLKNRGVARFGLNIANNPIPDSNLSPLLAPIGRYHITVGYGQPLGDKWEMNLAFEYQVKESKTYTNSQLPFGSNASIDVETMVFHWVLSRYW